MAVEEGIGVGHILREPHDATAFFFVVFMHIAEEDGGVVAGFGNSRGGGRMRDELDRSGGVIERVGPSAGKCGPTSREALISIPMSRFWVSTRTRSTSGFVLPSCRQK